MVNKAEYQKATVLNSSKKFYVKIVSLNLWLFFLEKPGQSLFEKLRGGQQCGELIHQRPEGSSQD